MNTHSGCKRVRVAIDVSEAPGAPLAPRLHIGHARTVLLASLIASELDLPFHIRLDAEYCPERKCVAGILMPLCTIISHLGIQCSKVYWQPQGEPALSQYEAAFGDRAAEIARVLRVATSHVVMEAGLMADDLIFHYPSLVVRGMEFVDPSLTQAGSQHTAARFVAVQLYTAEAMGRTWHEINVPLITVEGHKVSKSLGPTLNWEFFERVPGDWVRDFLLATALNAGNPMEVLGQPFSIDAMTKLSYEWNWDEWEQYIRDCEARATL